MTVVVFGSINMDLVVRAARLPVAGETLTGTTFFTASGGKGGNQAVASARLGVLTRMVGRVGDDVFGSTLRHSLKGYGVDASGVTTVQSQPSGVALITVNEVGENTIIVVPGANGTVGTDDDLQRLDEALAEAKVLLLQLEIPLEAVRAAAQAAHARALQVILDPAPARSLPADLYPLLDVITPNQTEAAALVGFPVTDQPEAQNAAEVLLTRGVGRVVIKMGGQGAYWMDASAGHFMPAIPVKVVDTVAAGDAFNGGLAAALAEGHEFSEAVRWGTATGALSVTKAGAQPSMPDRDELMALLA